MHPIPRVNPSANKHWQCSISMIYWPVDCKSKVNCTGARNLSCRIHSQLLPPIQGRRALAYRHIFLAGKGLYGWGRSPGTFSGPRLSRSLALSSRNWGIIRHFSIWRWAWCNPCTIHAKPSLLGLTLPSSTAYPTGLNDEWRNSAKQPLLDWGHCLAHYYNTITSSGINSTRDLASIN